MSDHGDLIDRANDRAAMDTENAVTAARDYASRIPQGHPGECELCGCWSGRLVDGACAPCRDRYGLP